MANDESRIHKLGGARFAKLTHLGWTVLGRFNVWVLDRYDIRTSVFPSGHVTAAFSAAFGLLLAFPERKSFGAGLLVLATAIAIATVYGRYHYFHKGSI